eukprot:jgi/Chlat1/4665/Chrsp3S05640
MGGGGSKVRYDAFMRLCQQGYFKYADQQGDGTIDSSELYNAVLYVYSELNKRLPKPAVPPTREEVFRALRAQDKERNGQLTREEFGSFMLTFAGDLTVRVVQKIVTSFLLLPILAMGVKRAAGRVPGVPAYLGNIPDKYLYAFTTAARLFGTGLHF